MNINNKETKEITYKDEFRSEKKFKIHMNCNGPILYFHHFEINDLVTLDSSPFISDLKEWFSSVVN